MILWDKNGVSFHDWYKFKGCINVANIHDVTHYFKHIKPTYFITWLLSCLLVLWPYSSVVVTIYSNYIHSEGRSCPSLSGTAYRLFFSME